MVTMSNHRPLAPANLLIDGAVDYIHHAAGSQFGAQDNDGKKAEAEEQSEDRNSEALCMLFDGLSQNRQRRADD